jgi:hypothetical protein
MQSYATAVPDAAIIDEIAVARCSSLPQSHEERPLLPNLASSLQTKASMISPKELQ